MGITRELDKEFLLYFYPIYINYTWSVLQIIKPTLISILHSYIYLMSYSRLLCCICVPWHYLPDPFTMFYAYDITSCDMSCDYNVMCLFIVQKKIKKRKEGKINIKSEKLNKRKEKLSVSKAFYNSYCQEYSMKYIYSTSQMSKLSLILCTFSITSSVASLFLTTSRVCEILQTFIIFKRI